MSRSVCISCGRLGSEIAKVLKNVKVIEFGSEQCCNKGEVIDAIKDADKIILALSDYGKVGELLSEASKEIFENKVIVNYTATTIAQIQELYDKVSELGAKLVSGSVICYYDALGTEDAYVVYSGEKAAYEVVADIVEVLGGAHYEGENIIEASLMDFTANGIHYSYLLAFYTGVAMCKKYDFPLETYLYHTLKSLPPLAEAAYRNIWIGLDDPRSFEEIDDVIHGMEMLVCLLKKSGGKDEVRYNTERQKALNDILYQHWNDLMDDYSKLQA